MPHPTPSIAAAALALLVALTVVDVATSADPPPPQGTRGPAVREARPAEEPAARLAWSELAPALAEAKRLNKPLLVDVYTEWCGWCKRMDKTTYGHPDVRDYVARSFVTAKVDAEDDRRRATYLGESRSYRQFADGFRISGYPTTLFLEPDGSLITQLPGYVKPEPFLDVLHYIGEGHYRTQSWEAYSRDPETRRP